MTPEEIRTHPPTALTPAQRDSYFENGYLAAEGLIPPSGCTACANCRPNFLRPAKPLQHRTKRTIWALGIVRISRMCGGCGHWSTAIRISGGSPVSRYWPISLPTWWGLTSNSIVRN